MTRAQKNRAFSLVNRPEGFTLIELLVVIAILAILMAALFLAINPVAMLQRSRNARRMQELGELNKAIANAVANQDITGWGGTATRNSCTGTFGVTGGNATDWFGGFTGTLTGFIPRLPRDPLNTATGSFCYYGESAADGTWELNATLEGDTGPMLIDGGTSNAFYEVGTSLGLI